MKRIEQTIVGLLVMMFALTACSEEDAPEANGKVINRKVAVIMPASEQARWSRIATWALDNLKAAQQGLPQQVKLEIEWFDEEASEWEAFVKQAVADESYAAIIGPQSSVNAQKAAQLCNKQ